MQFCMIASAVRTGPGWSNDYEFATTLCAIAFRLVLLRSKLRAPFHPNRNLELPSIPVRVELLSNTCIFGLRAGAALLFNNFISLH